MKKVNHIAFVIDKSGSMNKIRQQTINNINEQLDVIQDSVDDQEDLVTVVTFSGKVSEPTVFSLDERFTEEDYVPRGNTALFDAIGLTVETLQEVEVLENEDTSYLVVILSDGEENASKRYGHTRISSMINELEDQGDWTFTFIGADKRCLDRMVRMGIKSGNSATFEATPEGMTAGSTMMTKGLLSYKSSRSAGSRQSNTFYKAS